MQTNARILTLDRANNKLLVTIKKLYCPDDEMDPAARPGIATDPNKLNLVDGGFTNDAEEDPSSNGGAAAAEADPEEEGDGYNLC